MKRTILILLMMLWVGSGFPVGSHGETQPETESQTEESKRFPIVTRLEMERAYGFFIGDEIPLTLEIETEHGVVLDW